MDVPITSDWEEDLGYWRQGDVWSVTRSKEDDAATLQPFHDHFGLDRQLPAIGPEWTTTNVPFKYGWVSIRHQGCPDEYSPLVVALTEALALGYRRYLDFKHLEESLRALERDRVVEQDRGWIVSRAQLGKECSNREAAGLSFTNNLRQLDTRRPR